MMKINMLEYSGRAVAWLIFLDLSKTHRPNVPHIPFKPELSVQELLKG